VPELPEVETVVRELRPRLVNRRILSAEILHPRIARYCQLDMSSVLAGRQIRQVHRHGKFILIELDRGWLTIHLGMTGSLLFDAEPGKHTRAVFRLEDSELLYNDPRMFGSIEWGEEPVRARKLGPDAFEAEELAETRMRRRAPIKAVLLNQQVFSGVGNIYADEALFRAAIHPRRRADRLSPVRARRLIAMIREVLGEAVQSRGSSVSDYVDTEGRRGGFQLQHRVYAREGQPCVQCGSPIRKIVVAGRGTHYCPKCQR
jgi:formamidopyrimidine-DNA glycosylase